MKILLHFIAGTLIAFIPVYLLIYFSYCFVILEWVELLPMSENTRIMTLCLLFLSAVWCGVPTAIIGRYQS